MINQPLAVVLAHLRAVTSGTEGLSAESDPTLEAVHVAWGRQVCVRYAVYAAPGGVQVTASIESKGHSRLDLMTVMAVHLIVRLIATNFSTMRDDVE